MQSTRILLIEDDPVDADYLQEILSEDKSRAFEIECLASLQDALERIPKGNFDIVLSDLSLPDSRGLDTFTALKKSIDTIPLLVLTGLDDEQTALETLRQGAQDYLVKGHFDGAVLIKAIQFGLEREKIRRELALATDQLSQANERLDILAHNDPLTGLLNRRGLDQVISRELARANRHGSSVMVIIIDLDDFKKINDNLGHSFGDGVLKELAARIQQPLRSTDVSARIGGDEFLILLPDTDSAEGIKIAEKVRSVIFEKPFHVPPHDIKVSASMGAIPVTGTSLSLDDLLEETHDLLYKSKKEGKNRVSFVEKRRDSERPDRGANIVEQFKAVNQFNWVKQGIFDLTRESIVAYEFLVRSSIPTMESPLDFFRLSYENNMGSKTDRECLEVCLAAAMETPLALRRHINVSASTLAEVPTAELLALIQKNNQGEKFCLEINQKDIVGDPSYLLPAIQALKSAGILIALENANLGQSILESAILLKPDFLKIDKQQVIGISQNEPQIRSLKRFVKIADSLKIEVMAVGIETREDLEALKSIGIKYGQGFLWGKPSAAANVESVKQI